jgi:hypothetical protein
MSRTRTPEQKAAHAEGMRRFRAENPESNAQASKRWRDKHPEKSAERLRAYRQRNKEALSIRGRQRRQNRKAEAMEAYGGKCACCGEDNLVFLTIDHIDGKGGEHRKAMQPKAQRSGGGDKTYRWLKANGYPEGFQCLCFNCNSGRAINGGICPHQAAKLADALL